MWWPCPSPLFISNRAGYVALGLQGASSERLIFQTINRSPERLISVLTLDRALEHLIKRSNTRSSVRTLDQALERLIERSNTRSSVRTLDQALERMIERSNA
ncbi:hypothetical protein PGT21_019305 [Puccinia graminis f. sp. tritici]|uniref:Uncharacterized protein n=1 Tax=Puccinia graminis f. sp. tritici TaxID=56615 RepID=A0A5B0PY04_PUCGR|nr:hypothetical protein PGT21_025311 [Puccinia graminis f. sp. tritici]KAA1105783.1 hypothetical protein PGT21_019305 [Puccinia graminis f. sp. tritici]